MRRLVLLRHGVTDWNLVPRFQGHADIPLSSTGRDQAAAAAAYLARLRPARLWSSDLRRASETASYVAAATGLEPVLDGRLREVDVGDFQGLTHDEARARFGPGPWDYGAHGGESNADLAARIVAPIRDAAAALAEGEVGVVVSHGHAIRLGAIGFLRWPVGTVATLAALGNCAWVELVEAPASASSPAPWRLAGYNVGAPIS